MIAQVRGSDKFGMTLADVRKFVKETKTLDERTWVDCEIPAADGEGGEFQTAALMGLSV